MLFENDHTTNKSNLKNNECGTKNTESDQTYSTTSTSTVISNKKYISRPNDNTTVQKDTVPKNINIDKYDYNDLTIENLKDNERQLEDSNSKNLDDIATVQFLDQLNLITLILMAMK